LIDGRISCIIEKSERKGKPGGKLPGFTDIQRPDKNFLQARPEMCFGERGRGGFSGELDKENGGFTWNFLQIS